MRKLGEALRYIKQCDRTVLLRYGGLYLREGGGGNK
jgi:hypothetical protein